MSRTTKKPEKMSSLLQASSGTLAQIAEKTNYLTQLSDIVRQICPDLPVDAWHIANFRQNTVIIEVNSSVWGQRLQFERMNICRELTLLTSGMFSQVDIKVNPFRAKAAEIASPTNHRYHHISPAAARHLEHLAENAPQSLKEKLIRLAKLAR